MSVCADCAVRVEGEWLRCPLCAAPLTGEPESDPFPRVPLAFSRRRVLRLLLGISVAVIAGSFAAQLLFGRGESPIGVFRSIWIGVSALWLVVIMAVRTRRNVAKSAVHLVIVVSLVCLYWDYLSGGAGWALTYAVPLLTVSVLLALVVTVRVLRAPSGEHIVYTGALIVFGLLPVWWLSAGWTTVAWPSVSSVAVSVAAMGLLLAFRRHDMRAELEKRFFV